MSTPRDESQNLMAAQRAYFDQERAAIAKELHDNISQALTALTLELALLQGRVGTVHPEAPKLREMVDLVTGINKSVRKVTNEVWPKAVEEFGLIAALRSLCHSAERELKVPVSFSAAAQQTEPRADVARELYHLVRRVIFAMGSLRPSSVSLNVASDEKGLRVRLEAEAIDAAARSRINVGELNQRAAVFGAAVHSEEEGADSFVLIVHCGLAEGA